jgi:beta-glucanase (GH16 family)
MIRTLAVLILLASLPAVAGAAERTLIWSDEFDGSSLDTAKWSVARDCWGGGNQERQCYTDQPANVTVAGGELRITAHKGPVSGPAQPARLGDPGAVVHRGYSSAKVESRGAASFRYGRIEVRARLPKGQGLWPAIWMLPEHDNYGPYPLSGEVDIAEAVNLGTPRRDTSRLEDRVYGTLHHGPNLAANRQWGGHHRLKPVDGFHVFALEWTPKRMTWSVDGEAYFRTPTRKPFDERFHLILNLAVGGRWPESQNLRGIDSTAFPATLVIDWVRVYR